MIVKVGFKEVAEGVAQRGTEWRVDAAMIRGSRLVLGNIDSRELLDGWECVGIPVPELSSGDDGGWVCHFSAGR